MRQPISIWPHFFFSLLPASSLIKECTGQTQLTKQSAETRWRCHFFPCCVVHGTQQLTHTGADNKRLLMAEGRISSRGFSRGRAERQIPNILVDAGSARSVLSSAGIRRRLSKGYGVKWTIPDHDFVATKRIGCALANPGFNFTTLTQEVGRNAGGGFRALSLAQRDLWVCLSPSSNSRPLAGVNKGATGPGVVLRPRGGTVRGFTVLNSDWGDTCEACPAFESEK
ncbi:hypothetical protein BaRGS_00010437 [Batillaria attramentaria]|uniref:Uncharacterized protein n=1 Tax=Batillaria attramentaria TaxID=370345 RepID=A0ABD0LGK4_9CAEN